MIVSALSSRIVLLATLESLENTTQKKTADKMLKICSCKTTRQKLKHAGKKVMSSGLVSGESQEI